MDGLGRNTSSIARQSLRHRTATRALGAALVTHNLHNPFQRHPEVPTTFHVLDLIKFAGEKIAQPMYSFHAHYGITT